jgi:iron complex outermembrane receptor protein
MKTTVRAGIAILAATVASVAVAAEPAGAPVTLSIGSQPVRSALKAFAEQTGLQVMIRIDAPALDGLIAQPVSGTLPPREALDLLLSRSGLKYEFVNDRAVRIVRDGEASLGVTGLTESPGATRLLPAAQSFRLAQTDAAQGDAPRTSGAASESEAPEVSLQEVTVFGRGVRQPVREIPQTVTSIDQELLLKNTAETSLENVVRFIPSASNLLGEYGIGLYINLRGFEASTIWNGMPFRNTNQSPSLSNVERIEVLMGPASVLYGSMEPGGVINIVTKQPKAEFHFAASAQAGSNDILGGDIDVGGPLSDRVRVRLNLSHDQAGAEFDHYRRELLNVAPVLAIDLGPDTLLTLEGQYMRTSYPLGFWENTRPAVGSLLPNPGLGALPGRVNYAYMEDFTNTAYDSTDLSARLSHRFGEATSFNASYNYHMESRHDEAIFAGFDIGSDGRSIDRYPFIVDGDNDEHSFHADVRHELAFGRVRHELMLGTDVFAGDSVDDYLNSDFGLPPIDAYDPDYSFVSAGPFTPEHLDIHSEIKEVAIQDRVRFGDRWALLIGMRYTDFETDSLDVFGGEPAASHFSGSEMSSQLGLVYDLSDRVTLFANRNEAFVPRNELDVNNRPFEPEQSRQTELGAKFDVGDGGLTGNAAVFRIEKPNVLAIAPNDPSARVPIGAVQVRGVELSMQGRLAPHWSLYAGYAYLDSEMEDAGDFNAEGAEFGNTPEHSFSVITHYELQGGPLARLGLNLAYQYMGERWGDTGIPDDASTPDVDETVRNVLRLPSYHRVDLGASYPLGERLTLSVHGNNLLDEGIYANSFGWTYTYVGVGRNYSAQLRYEF